MSVSNVDSIEFLNDCLLDFYKRHKCIDTHCKILKLVNFIKTVNYISTDKQMRINLSNDLASLQDLIIETDIKLGTKFIDAYMYMLNHHTINKGKVLDMLSINEINDLEEAIKYLRKIVEGREI